MDLKTPTPDSFRSCSTMAALVPVDQSMVTFQRELDALTYWFTTLNSPERIAALKHLTCLASPHELAAVVPVASLSSERQAASCHGTSTAPPQQPSPQRQGSTPPSDPWPSDPQYLYAWLRKRRLHKYTSHLVGMEPSKVREMDHDSLIRLGIDTRGARTKLLKVGQCSDRGES